MLLHDQKDGIYRTVQICGVASPTCIVRHNTSCSQPHPSLQDPGSEKLQSVLEVCAFFHGSVSHCVYFFFYAPIMKLEDVLSIVVPGKTLLPETSLTRRATNRTSAVSKVRSSLRLLYNQQAFTKSVAFSKRCPHCSSTRTFVWPSAAQDTLHSQVIEFFYVDVILLTDGAYR